MVSAIYVTSGSLDHGTFVFEKRGVVTFVGCVALRRTSHPLKFQKVSAAHDGIGGWRTKHAINLVRALLPATNYWLNPRGSNPNNTLCALGTPAGGQIWAQLLILSNDY